MRAGRRKQRRRKRRRFLSNGLWSDSFALQYRNHLWPGLGSLTCQPEDQLRCGIIRGPGPCFFEAPETLRACQIIFNFSVSKTFGCTRLKLLVLKESPLIF